MDIKTMSLIQKMQKDHDKKKLKQQMSNMKEAKERLTTKLDPIQEVAMDLSHTITNKKEELTTLVE